MTIDDIITRLEKSGAPDRVLDGDIAEMFGSRTSNGILRCAGYLGIADFTGSIDSAIRLFNLLLPNCGRSMSKGRTRPDEPLYGCQIYASDYVPKEEDVVVVSEAEHDVEAICLCLAILKALPERAP